MGNCCCCESRKDENVSLVNNDNLTYLNMNTSNKNSASNSLSNSNKKLANKDNKETLDNVVGIFYIVDYIIN